jgi:hypothetical protein
MRALLTIPLTLLLFVGLAEAGESRLAIIIGNNAAVDDDLQPLQYADDDAFKYARFLAPVVDDLELLATADKASAKLFPKAAREALAPTRAGVEEAVARTVANAHRLAGDGEDVVVFFIFSGHGNYDEEGRGYLHLEDGRFTTRDLFYHLVGEASDFRLVLLIDACNAGFLVQSRGGSDRRPSGPSTLDLEDYDNVGLILSSSSAGEVREWGRYLAGIFSHQVRSGLTGAADVDGDGRITFQELAAFVSSANARVENPVLRLSPYIRPPLSAPDMALIDLADAGFERVLEARFEVDSRVSILDEALVRYADLHLSAGHTARVGLATSGEVMVVANQTLEYVVPASSRGAVKLADLDARSVAPLAARGVDRYYRKHLFAEPYSRDYAVGWLARDYPGTLVFERVGPGPWYDNGWAWTAAGVGLALATSGGIMTWEAGVARKAAQDTLWADEKSRQNDRMERLQAWSIGAYAVGAGALATSIVLFITNRPDERREVRPVVGPGIMLIPIPGGAGVEATF